MVVVRMLAVRIGSISAVRVAVDDVVKAVALGQRSTALAAEQIWIQMIIQIEFALVHAQVVAQKEARLFVSQFEFRIEAVLLEL